MAPSSPRPTSTPSPLHAIELDFDAGPPPDHDLVEVAAGAADVGVLDLHGELDLAREASRRRRRERRLVHVEPRRDEVEAERRGPAAWRVVDGAPTPSTRQKPAHAAARDVAPDDGVEAHRLLQEALLAQHEVDARAGSAPRTWTAAP